MTKGKKKQGSLVKSFKEDKVKNANIIVDFLQLLESNEKKDIEKGIQGLREIFLHLLSEGDIKTPSDLPDDLMVASQKFSKWLYDRFSETHEKLLIHLRHKAATVPVVALSAIIELMKAEGQRPITEKSAVKSSFPSARLQALISELVSDDVNHQRSIPNLKEHLECQDFTYHTIVSTKNVVKKHKSNEATEIYLNNVILLMEHVSITNVEGDVIVCKQSFIKNSRESTSDEAMETDTAPELSYAKTKRAFNVIWRNIMTYPLTNNLYRRCLIVIPDKVMHHLEKPLQLTGFFMDAYDLGGAVSLLALQGVFILVNKYNLDYPNFYEKLYGLLEPTVFHAKYRPRFFMLMDRFLASSHIPEYIVAAFIKRLSRLSLVAPASCLVLILKFIANLLIRFPGLQKLIHNPDAGDVECDPYDPNEPDMSKCRSCESSLWEIASLEKHAIPSISKATGFLSKKLPNVEYDISELVEKTYEEVHEKSCKVSVRETVSTTFYKPSGLFAHHDDKMSDMWSTV